MGEIQIIGYAGVETIDADDSALFPKVTLPNGRTVTVARTRVTALDPVDGRQITMEVLAPTYWCYNRVRDVARARVAAHAARPGVAEDARIVGQEEVAEEVLDDGADAGGDVAGRPDGWDAGPDHAGD